jgi:hypothetical protein
MFVGFLFEQTFLVYFMCRIFSFTLSSARLYETIEMNMYFGGSCRYLFGFECPVPAIA